MTCRAAPSGYPIRLPANPNPSGCRLIQTQSQSQTQTPRPKSRTRLHSPSFDSGLDLGLVMDLDLGQPDGMDGA